MMLSIVPVRDDQVGYNCAIPRVLTFIANVPKKLKSLFCDFPDVCHLG